MEGGRQVGSAGPRQAVPAPEERERASGVAEVCAHAHSVSVEAADAKAINGGGGTSC